MRGRAWIGGLASAMALGTVPLGCGGDDGGRADDDAAEEHVDADGDAAAGADADADLETESTIEDGRDEATAEEVADDGSEPAPGAPLFAEAAVVAVTIAASGDPADVYYPAPPDLAPGAYAFPVAVLLQGAKVDKQHYAGFAATAARYGFVVAVPNHESTTLLGRGLYAEQSEPSDVLAQLRAENDDPASPLHGIIEKVGMRAEAVPVHQLRDPKVPEFGTPVFIRVERMPLRPGYLVDIRYNAQPQPQ